MTDLKVWVDGKERVIRGVSQGTTCESVVLVLAKAAGKSGKVALLEKWRDFERILPRNENPLKCLEAWGTHKKDVRLVLQDDDSLENTIDSIKFTSDNKYDLIKRSVDCGSLENFTAIQERKLKTLSRALEIVDVQISCWDDNDEKFLYLTEDEIIEDFSLKLSQTVKLQAKELSELGSLQTELRELQHFNQNSTSKFQLYSEKFSQFESEIADTYDVVEKLLIQIENCERNEAENVVCFDMQSEIRVLQLELDEQKRLSHKQDKELETIQSSVSELTQTFHLKTNKIEQLKNEITSEEVFYDLDEHFRPLSPEEEPYLYRQSLSSDSVDNEVSTQEDTKNITKDFPEVKASGSNTSYVEDDADKDASRRSSCGSPEEFFKNWSSSPIHANSPLNYFSFVNGVKTSQSNPPRLSLKSKIDSQTSGRKWENGKNENENSGKMKLPFFEGANKTSMRTSVEVVDALETASTGKQFVRHSSTDNNMASSSRIQNNFFSEGKKAETSLSTKKSSSSPFKTVSDTNVRFSSNFPKESSTTETKLHKEMRKHSADNILSVLSMQKAETKDDTSTTSSKLQTNPKPLKNSPQTLGLPNVAKSSALNGQEKPNSKFNSGSKDQRKTEKLPPATFPKPWRKSSSGTQGSTRAGASSFSSRTIPDKSYLLPPSVQHKRTHRIEKPLSHGDLYEEGVFV